jgi:endonuclease-3
VPNNYNNRVTEILRILQETYPLRQQSLKGRTPFKLLIATILSAQSTDLQVNRVAKQLFKQFPTVEAFASANLHELEQAIYQVGYYRQKARFLKATGQLLLEEFGGKVPQSMEELIRLPGVGRKTANIVLNRAFGIVKGIAVDTHVFRVARRLGLSEQKIRDKVEQDLMQIIPQSYWGQINLLFITHGRRICKARRPECEICPINHLCNYFAQLGF